MSWTLYILKCKGDKWYVGITSKTPEERLDEHRRKVRGAYWTMKYEPESIYYREDLGEVSKDVAEKYEDQVTLKYMKQHGVNNVRGGHLRDTSEYVVRFGRIFDKEGWKDVCYALVILLILAAFYIDKYIIVFIPGHAFLNN